MKKMSLVMLFFLQFILINACKEKITEIDYNPNVLSAKDYIRAEDAVFEIVNAFFKGINDTLVINHGYGYIDNCDVTYYPSDSSMTFGYGVENRMCQDNKYRRGLYRVECNGKILIEGVTAYLVTDSLFVDDSLVEADLEIQNLGINENDLPEYSLKVVSCVMRIPDTTKTNGVSISADFRMVWAEGSATPEIHEDDIFLISGNASGSSSDGFEFSVNVQEPLMDYLDCFWISQGISKINVPTAEFPTGDIDYILEDGCNNDIDFWFNGNRFFDSIK